MVFKSQAVIVISNLVSCNINSSRVGEVSYKELLQCYFDLFTVSG
jgi:hypothetical protein